MIFPRHEEGAAQNGRSMEWGVLFNVTPALHIMQLRR